MHTTAEERVRLEARRHGIVLVRPLLNSLALALLGGAAFLGGRSLSPVAAALLAVAALFAVAAVFRWDRTRIVVTGEELSIVHGVLRRDSATVRLAHLGAVEVEQSLLGRLLGYGTIVAGELEIPYVPEPRRVSATIGRLSR